MGSGARAADAIAAGQRRVGLVLALICGDAVAVAVAFALAYTIRFARILRTTSADLSRSLARDLLKVSVIYLPLLMTALMLCAIARH